MILECSRSADTLPIIPFFSIFHHLVQTRTDIYSASYALLGGGYPSARSGADPRATARVRCCRERISVERSGTCSGLRSTGTPLLHVGGWPARPEGVREGLG